jgi:hypothetical protein
VTAAPLFRALVRFSFAACLPVIGACGGDSAASVDELPTLALREDLRIGDATDPDRGFNAVSEVTVDRDGQVYAFDVREREIRVFAPSGEMLRTIGRPGSGPGEFASAVQFGIAGDTVYAFSLRAGCVSKIMLFDRAGTHLSTSEAPGARVEIAGGRSGVVRPRKVRSDGKLLGEMDCYPGGGAAGAAIASTDTVRVPFVLFSAVGEVLDTLGWHSVPALAAVTPERIQIEGFSHQIPVPPSSIPLTIAMPDGRVIVERAVPLTVADAVITVTRTDFAGDTVYHKSLRYEPMPYTEAMLDSIVHRSVRTPGNVTMVVSGVVQRRAFSDPDAAAATLRARMSFPRYQMPVHQAIVGADGAIWLRREDTGANETRWLLIDADGNARGHLTIPSATRIVWSSGDTMLAVVSDDDGIPWVVRYGISRDGG